MVSKAWSEAAFLLAIESSCDDTAAAVIHRGKVLANLVATQNIHALYGGVVPEAASRAHQQHIVPVVDQALQQAGISAQQLNAVAFTQGPGLMGSLMVGAAFAKGMAAALDVPLIGIDHMKAHVMALLIDTPKPSFPFLCLTVSGGHTQIVRVDDWDQFEILGATRDDAAGEAFDKSAKLLGLPYPGGPLIDRLAGEGDPERFALPVANLEGLDFSFSGLKTAILYLIRKGVESQPDFIERNKADLCASIQNAILSALIRKLESAVKLTGIHQVGVAGGVAANSGLRKLLQEKALLSGWQCYIPALQYCTDNAGMIGMMAWQLWQRGFTADQGITPYARQENS